MTRALAMNAGCLAALIAVVIITAVSLVGTNLTGVFNVLGRPYSIAATTLLRS